MLRKETRIMRFDMMSKHEMGPKMGCISHKMYRKINGNQVVWTCKAESRNGVVGLCVFL